MTAFHTCREVEKAALADLLPYVNRKWPGVELVPTDGHEWLQKKRGDFLVNPARAPYRGGGLSYVEVKAEQMNRYGNLFLEAWSNYPVRLGWMHTCVADFVWYYFVDDRQLYWWRQRELRLWAFEGGDDGLGCIHGYHWKRQAKHDQKNVTVGWPVPIEHVRLAVPSFHGPVDPTTD